MILTEQEARSKACPFAKNFDASFNPKEHGYPTCIASSCMAWDFIQPPFEHLSRQYGNLREDGTRPVIGERWHACHSMDYKGSQPMGEIVPGATWVRHPTAIEELGAWIRPKTDRTGQCLRAVTVTEE